MGLVNKSLLVLEPFSAWFKRKIMAQLSTSIEQANDLLHGLWLLIITGGRYEGVAVDYFNDDDQDVINNEDDHLDREDDHSSSSSSGSVIHPTPMVPSATELKELRVDFSVPRQDAEDQWLAGIRFRKVILRASLVLLRMMLLQLMVSPHTHEFVKKFVSIRGGSKIWPKLAEGVREYLQFDAWAHQISRGGGGGG